jgi:DNA polymerase elongation subunit (family B)
MKEKNKNSPKILFIDIETSYATGWFWRPGYNLNITYDQILTEPAIICVCYKYNDSGKVYSLSWDKGDDKELCKEFHRILNTADIVVGHNGDKFDIPWLKTRMLFHGISNMPEIQSIDTLKIARSKFKFNSNRLDYLGKFFGFGGKKDTGGIDLWHDIIQHNSNIALKKMISYCCRDVILLEKVYNKLQLYIKPKIHVGIFQGHSKCSCPKCGSERTKSDGNLVSAAGIRKKKMECLSCRKYFSISEKTYLDNKK